MISAVVVLAAAARPAEAAPPPIPSFTSVTAGNESVEADWSSRSGATQYSVQRATTTTGPWLNLTGCVNVTSSSCTGTSLINGTAYYFRVRAGNAANEYSAYSAAYGPRTPLAPPPAPAGLTADGGVGQVALSWSAARGATGYEVQRAVVPNALFTAVCTTASTQCVSSGANGTEYRFRVRARTAPNSWSAFSPAVNATPLALPGAPAGLQATVIGDTFVALSWNAAAGATSYTAQQRLGPNALFVNASPCILVGQTSCVAANLSTNFQYYFRVMGANANGDYGPASAVIGPLTPRVPADPVQNIIATPGNHQVELRWDAAGGAESYNVLQSTDGTTFSSSAGCQGLFQTQCVVTGLTNWVGYYFKIVSVNENGLNTYSEPAGPVVPMPLWGPGGTGSVRLLKASAGCTYEPGSDDRMERVADLVLREDPDVVLVDTVYFNACRSQLINFLDATHPNYFTLNAVEDHPPCRFPMDNSDPDGPTERDDGGAVISGGNYTGSSGLMLFSKFPFEPYPDPFQSNDSCVAVAQGQNDGDTFSDNESTPTNDLLGIFYEWSYSAMVRIRPPGSDAINVVITQLQDGETDDGEPCGESWNQMVRRHQLENIETMIRGTLTQQQRAQEPVFLLGDLGIDGNRAPEHTLTAYDPNSGFDVSWYRCDSFEESTLELTNFAEGEWERVFHDLIPPADTFFYSKAGDCIAPSCTTNDSFLFTDVWGFEHPSTGPDADWGQTELERSDDDETWGANYYVGQSSVDTWRPLDIQTGRRTDYILRNQPMGPEGLPYLSTSHIRRIFFYDPDISVQNFQPPTMPDNHPISNHYYLVADFLFNRPPFSNPRPNDGSGPLYGAKVVDFSSDQDQLETITLNNHRHHAWFFVNVQGTVTAGSTAPEDVQIDIYHHTDLSTPMPNYHGLQNCFRDVCGPVFDLPDPPYYVRYSIKPESAEPKMFLAGLHLHKCSDPISDYCLLPNAQDRTVTWPAGAENEPYAPGTAAYLNEMYFIASVDKRVADAPVSFRIETEHEQQFNLAGTAAGDGAKLFPLCGYVLSAADCGTGACNQPIEGAGVWPGIWDDDDGDLIFDQVLDTRNQHTGKLSPAVPGVPRPVLLRVKRNCTGAGCFNTRMTVRYTSPEFRVVPLKLKVVIENDFGDNNDEVWMSVVNDVGSSPGAESCFADDPPPGIELEEMDPSGEGFYDETIRFGAYATDANLTTHSANAYVTFCESDGSGALNDFIGEVAIDSSTAHDVQHDETMTIGDVVSKYIFSYMVKSDNPIAPLEQCP